MIRSSKARPSDTPIRNSTPLPSLSQDSGFVASDSRSHASSGIFIRQMMRLVGTVKIARFLSPFRSASITSNVPVAGRFSAVANAAIRSTGSPPPSA